MVRIFRRKNKAGNRSSSWYGDWVDLTGKRVVRKLSVNKRRAGRMLSAIVADVERGTYIDPRGQVKDITVQELVDRYMEWTRSQCAKSTVKAKLSCVGLFAKEYGTRSVRSITLDDLETYRAGLIKRVQHGSAALHVQYLKHLFRQAARWKYLHFSPASDLIRPRPSQGIVRFLELDEIDKLMSECHNPMLHDAVLLSLNTGLRKSELFHMQRTDVDLKRDVIAVMGKGHKQAYVPINATSKRVLMRLMARVGQKRLFVRKNGKPLDRMDVSFKAACTRAGITAFRWHDLRHTFASQLVMAGVDLNRVRELMRHSTITQTLRYAHLSPGNLADAIKVLDRK